MEGMFTKQTKIVKSWLSSSRPLKWWPPMSRHQAEVGGGNLGISQMIFVGFPDNHSLGGGFKDFLFSPLFGEMIQFD